MVKATKVEASTKRLSANGKHIRDGVVPVLPMLQRPVSMARYGMMVVQRCSGASLCSRGLVAGFGNFRGLALDMTLVR